MTGADPAVLDDGVLTALAESVGDDHAFVVDLIDAYLTDGAAQMDAVESAVEARSADDLVRPAHTLKSSSATLGALRVAATARELEVAARSGILDDGAAALARRLRDDWAEAANALRAWAGGESPT